MQGYDGDKAKILARLRRVEGQVHAVAQMGGEVADEKLSEVEKVISRLVRS